MLGIDFNLPLNLGQCTFADLSKELADEYRANCFLTTDRLPSPKAIRQMCPTISRQPSHKKFLLFRSIPLHGFCPDNIPPVSAGHRNVSACHAAETLSLRYSRRCITNHSCQSKRESRLENIRRFRTDSDKQSSNTLCQRRLWHPVRPRGLCSGFINHRSMFVAVSMGKISQAQSGCQDTYPDGLKRLYTHVYLHYRRKSPRCQYPRRSGFVAGRHLCHGSRLSRLRSSFYVYPKPFNFCYKSQNQFRLSSSLLSPSRQVNRSSMRSDNHAQRLLCLAGLSCGSSSDRLLRYRSKQKIHLSDEQFFTGRIDHRSTLQVPMANRNLFQMDQAIPANQNFFRHQHQRGQNTNLDSYQRLCFSRNCQERTQNRAEFRRNLANSQHCTFRESPYRTSTYKNYIAK